MFLKMSVHSTHVFLPPQEIVANTIPEQHTEIPQLWNMRGLSRIRLENGKIIDNETGQLPWNTLTRLAGM